MSGILQSGYVLGLSSVLEYNRSDEVYIEEQRTNANPVHRMFGTLEFDFGQCVTNSFVLTAGE